MGFPDVIVEVAFDNDINEYLYAQAGYSDITQWVRSISGDLRGRRYEMERVETGSIRIALDNADGRFTPGRVSSPYFPNVKPARRCRIRGNNLQRLNIATTGSTDHNAHGFIDTSQGPTFDPPQAVEAGGYTNSHHIEVNMPDSMVTGTYPLLQWNVPLEIGRRTTHVVSVKRVSGTEVAGTGYIRLRYYDAAGTELSVVPVVSWSLPTSTTLTQRMIAHTPPMEAQYGIMSLEFTYNATTTAEVVYAVDAIQSNNSPNLAPNPSGERDADYWYVNGANETAADHNAVGDGEVFALMADGDSELFTFVPGVIPGETYSVTLNGKHTDSLGVPATTDLLLTADDGESGTLFAADPGETYGWFTASLTFTATACPQRLSLMKADRSDFVADEEVHVQRVNVVPGDVAPALYVKGSADDLLPWEAPKPVFEGWIEAWPARVNAQSSEVTVVVNDRLSRLGNITLENTWREAVFADGMQLIIPFDDDPVDASGKVAQIGTWASTEQIIDVPWLATRGDLGAANYVLGVDGPTDNTACEWNPHTASTIGYFLPIPHSNDYVAPPPPKPPAPKPTTTPKPPAATATYTTKTYVTKFYATWSRTYDGDGSTTWDDSAYMYQGYYSGDRGYTRSLAGFNYSSIKSTLYGATVKSCKLTLHNEHWWYNAGGTAVIGTHSYSSKPSSWSDGSVYQNRRTAHSEKDRDLTVELGVTIGNEFKAGTAKGIALGPTPGGLSYYGYFRGASQAGKPYLTITYTKRVRVS